jgi:hypothetical protein
MGEMLRLTVMLPTEKLTKEILDKLRAYTLSARSNPDGKDIQDTVTYELDNRKKVAIFTLQGTFMQVRQYHRALHAAALRYKGRVRMR